MHSHRLKQGKDHAGYHRHHVQPILFPEIWVRTFFSDWIYLWSLDWKKNVKCKLICNFFFPVFQGDWVCWSGESMRNQCYVPGKLYPSTVSSDVCISSWCIIGIKLYMFVQLNFSIFNISISNTMNIHVLK